MGTTTSGGSSRAWATSSERGASGRSHSGHRLPVQLEERLEENGRPAEIMNVALPGWSTRQQRIAYERIVRPYEPDAVLLGFCLNDVAELQNNLARPPTLLAEAYRRSNLMRALMRARSWEISRVRELFEMPQSGRVREAWERTFGELDALLRKVRRDDAHFALIVFPFRFQVGPDAPPPIPQKRLRVWAETRGVRFVDTLPALRARGDEAFVDYSHLSAAGGLVVAKKLVRTRVLVPRDSG